MNDPHNTRARVAMLEVIQRNAESANKRISLERPLILPKGYISLTRPLLKPRKTK